MVSICPTQGIKLWPQINTSFTTFLVASKVGSGIECDLIKYWES